MKTLILAGLAAGLLTASTPVAHADPVVPTPPDFIGGCAFDTVNQQMATGQSWIGEASVVIVATSGVADAGGTPVKAPDPTATISGVSCQFYINGVLQGTVLTAPNAQFVTANAGRFEFSATDTDTTTMCTNATITNASGSATYHRCGDGEVTQIPPQAVIDLINSFIEPIDPLICDVITLLGPTINGLGHPELLYVDMGGPKPPAVDPFGDDNDLDNGDGDLFVLGSLFWDCPPYVIG